MPGIRVRKTQRKDGAWVWPDGYRRLDQILGPAAGELLRPYWWAVDRNSYDYPDGWLAAADLDTQDPAQFARHPRHRAFEASLVGIAGEKIDVARPGFLPDFADVISGDWTALYGTSDDPRDLATAGLLDLRSRGIDPFFCPASALPAPVTAVVRGIDWAYWEIFTRNGRVEELIEQRLGAMAGLQVEHAFGH